MFIYYAWEHTLINSIRFVSTLFEHLKQFGIHPGEITIQTDNGSEFIGSIFIQGIYLSPILESRSQENIRQKITINAYQRKVWYPWDINW